MPFANLNNTTDGVVIYDRLGSTIDSVFYSNQFERKSGYSIERLSIEGSSNDPDNWAVSNSPQKGTPGFINSRVPKNYDLEVTTLLIDPEFPELGQNIKVAAEVKNIGLQSVNNFTLVLIIRRTVIQPRIFNRGIRYKRKSNYLLGRNI
ncbi:MAG: hypothetical protein U5K00_22860 [Melioribacteraceae bacterium]|nr:hypothetical protein [Melioribacteraceae bacterium]